MILFVVALTNVLVVVNRCQKEILSVFNLSGVMLLHRVSPTGHKLRKIGERVPTQEQTMISNRISQLESSFRPTEPAGTNGLAYASEYTSQFPGHNVGWLGPWVEPIMVRWSDGIFGRFLPPDNR